MAGDPVMSLLLVGLGVRTLSMSANLIGPVKKSIRGTEVKYLEGVANQLLHMETPSQVREKFLEHLNAYSCPAAE
jgi:phosphotransferase system enzyme I (PtsI)